MKKIVFSCMKLWLKEGKDGILQGERRERVWKLGGKIRGREREEVMVSEESEE